MPAIIRTPGVTISEDSSFSVSRSLDKKRKAPLAIEGTSGSNAAIGYEGREDAAQKYCLVVRDAATQQVELVEVPVFEVTPFVKSVRQHDLTTVIRQSGVKNWQMRTALGEAFGTKKAKTALSDVVRNRLDADMLDGLEDALVDNVQTRTAGLPSLEKQKEAQAAERPIPAHDAETTDVAAIYPLDGVVSSAELDALLPLVEELLAASQASGKANGDANGDASDNGEGSDDDSSRVDEDVMEKLPFSSSDFINAHVAQVLTEDTNVRPRLQLLAYLSFLRGIYQQRRATSRTTLVEKVGAELPRELYEGAISRFTVARAGNFGQSRDRSFAFDPFHIDKLLCYMLVLALHANNFALDVTPLAHELSVKPSRMVNLLRNLGAPARALTAAEARARELSAETAATYRIAELRAPLKLPDLAKRKRQE